MSIAHAVWARLLYRLALTPTAFKIYSHCFAEHLASQEVPMCASTDHNGYHDALQ